MNVENLLNKPALLFVCFGNTCRSPMAAAFAVGLLGNRVGVVQSAGIAVVVGSVVSAHGVKVLQQKYGINISEHQAQAVQLLDLTQFTHIIALDAFVYDYLHTRYPQHSTRLYAFNIADPYGNNEAVYAACAAEIIQQLEKWVAEVL